MNIAAVADVSLPFIGSVAALLAAIVAWKQSASDGSALKKLQLPYVLGIVGVILFVYGGFRLYTALAASSLPDREAVIAELKTEATRFNVRLPMRVGPDLVLEDTVPEGMDYRYIYRFTEKDASQIDKAAFEAQTRAYLKSDRCKQDAIAQLLKAGARMVMEYQDKNLNTFLKIVVDKDFCAT